MTGQLHGDADEGALPSASTSAARSPNVRAPAMAFTFNPHHLNPELNKLVTECTNVDPMLRPSALTVSQVSACSAFWVVSALSVLFLAHETNLLSKPPP